MQDATNVCINDLPPQCLQYIFSLLPGKAIGAAACVSRAWRHALTKDEVLWKDLCHREWGLSTPLWPNGGIHNSFREVFAVWQRGYAQYGPLAPRACRVCTTLFSWMQRNLPEVAASFRPGVTEAQLDAAERALGSPLPLALRVLYRFLNGQELEMDAALDANNSAPLHRSMLHGALGSYQFYDHVVSVRLLPLARAVKWTQAARKQLFPEAEGGGLPMVLFAASFNFNKMLLVDVRTGSVEACLSRAFPEDMLHAVPPNGPDGLQDGVLRWLEEFATRLTAGRYPVTTFGDAGVPPTPALSLFDMARPNTVEAVTRGVCVTATPLFVPEQSKIRGPRGCFLFAYCIRMRLLPTAEQKAAGERKPLKSVQLRSRWWRVRNSAGEATSDISGEGVISQFPVLTEGELLDAVSGDGVVGILPLLKAGGPEFSYSSCTDLAERQGSMEGGFRFAPSNLTNPSGADFEAQCPAFQLEVPSFIF